MTDTSPRLGLPYIQPSQAQKHVTHNEALRRLDTVTQLTIIDFAAETPPVLPGDGQIWALGADPTGDWAGQGGRLAVADSTGWQFITPQEGWLAWGIAPGELRIWTGGTWSAAAAGIPDQVASLGISAAADVVNRLSVASEAVLLSHAGAGHQLKLNKAAAADTGSVLFQSNWTGHAEMGLAGDTAFSVKVSADGSSWSTAMRADPAAQSISWAPAAAVRMQLSEAALQLDVPLTGTAVQAGPTDTTPGRVMLAQHGYGPGNLLGPVSETGGVPTGAVIERGSNADGDYVRFADGTQICYADALTVADIAAPVGAVFESPAVVWTYPAAFAAGHPVVVSCDGHDTRTWGGAGGAGSTSVTMRLLSPVSVAGPQTLRATAIGRWF